MKKHITEILLAVFVVFGFYEIAQSANSCTRTDWECYVSGPSQSPTTQWRIDSGGNVTSNGNVTISGNLSTTGTTSATGNTTISGVTIFPQTTSIGVSTITIITPTSTYLIVASSASNGTVQCGLSTFGGPGSTAAAPCIATGTATNGQYLIISATQTNATVTFSSGSAAGMDLGSATRVVQFGRNLSLIYNSTISEWTEVSYGSN